MFLPLSSTLIHQNHSTFPVFHAAFIYEAHQVPIHWIYSSIWPKNGGAIEIKTVLNPLKGRRRHFPGVYTLPLLRYCCCSLPAWWFSFIEQCFTSQAPVSAERLHFMWHCKDTARSCMTVCWERGHYFSYLMAHITVPYGWGLWSSSSRYLLYKFLLLWS